MSSYLGAAASRAWKALAVFSAELTNHREPEARSPGSGAVKENPVESELPVSLFDSQPKSVKFQWLDAAGARRETYAELSGSVHGGFRVNTSVPVDAGDRVWLADSGGESYRAVVRYRKQSSDGWVCGVSGLQAERRRHHRWPAEGSATLSWDPDDGVEAELRDISDSGAQLESPRAVPVGTRCRIAGDRLRSSGIIRGCLSRGDGKFRIGIQFTPDPTEITRWSAVHRLD